MKRLVISIGLVLSVIALFGQHVIGGKIGMHRSDIHQDYGIESLVPASGYTGLSIGVFAQVNLNENFSFRPELLYTQRGFGINQMTDMDILGVAIPVGAKLRTRVDYIELPLLLQGGISNHIGGVYANAGMSLGKAIGGSIQPRVTALVDWNLPAIDIPADSEQLRSIDASGIVGIGAFANVESGRIYLDVRYQRSWTSALDVNLVNIDMMSYGTQVSLGYAMAF